MRRFVWIAVLLVAFSLEIPGPPHIDLNEKKGREMLYHVPKRNSRKSIRNNYRLGTEILEPRNLLAADPIISEISAVNDTNLVDEDDDRSDWIEIRNVGDETLDLDGYYLTDDDMDLTRWRFPATVIEPNDHLVVFASGKDRNDAMANLHTNFRLNGDGETVVLTEPDGTTIRDQLEFGAQRSDVTFGKGATVSTTMLVGSDQPLSYVVPNESFESVGQAWIQRGYDDSDWNHGTGGVGYFVAPGNGLTGIPALHTPAGASGSQALGVPIGMDFVVHRPITVTALGAFDDLSNSTDLDARGFRSPIHVDLWVRNDGGTQDDFSDDFAGTLVASERFLGTVGTQVGGSRYRSLASPIELQPGSYTISARGYSDRERNAVALANEGFGSATDSSAISFVGSSRLGQPEDMFPSSVDVGNAHRYGAGSFLFVDDSPPSEPENGPYIAHRSSPGPGNDFTTRNLGLDFDVRQPIRVTELGVFDADQDGIHGTVVASIFSRDSGQLFATRDFLPGNDGELEAGTGSRFKTLDEPVFLPVGSYSMVSSGYLEQDPFSRFDINNAIETKLATDDSIMFTGTSRFSGNPSRFAGQAHHSLPDATDIGPVNRWTAGTFKFEPLIDEIVENDVVDEMYERHSTAYVRIPFDIVDADSLESLSLNINYKDGYAAFLNGTLVAGSNAVGELTWDSTANFPRSDTTLFAINTVDISEGLSVLENGRNVLAIQGVNARITSNAFGVRATLQADVRGDETIGYLGESTPGELNSAIVAIGAVAEPQLDVAGGIRESETEVVLSSETEDATIRYTLDGSQPSDSHGTRYTGPINIDSTTTLRAIAVKEGFFPSAIATNTYLFLDDVVTTSGTPDGFSSHWNGVSADYGIDQDPNDLRLIAGNPDASLDEARAIIKDSLQSLPTMSIVVDPQYLFGLGEGIYTNPYPRGRINEHVASVEYYLADGAFAYQIDAGLRMMGWTSRIPGVTPKHSLRLLFRDEYGDGRLDYPMFENAGTRSFDTLALRANSRDTWISDYPFTDAQGNPPTSAWPVGVERGAARSIAAYIRDEWSKSTQQALGGLAPDGNFVHLYLNGVYWGVYNPTERPDGAFAAEEFGGEEDDYDSVVFCNPTSRTSHGTLDAWNAMIQLADQGLASDEAYQRIQGNNPDGTRNEDFPRYLDVDNYVDYLIAGHYDATDDWPCNFYALRSRGPDPSGFQWVTWDNDLAIPNLNTEASRIVPNLTGTPKSSPWRLHSVLSQNAEYRMRFADRAHKHLFNDGALTPTVAAERWESIGNEIAPGLIAESARWGDYRRDVDLAGPAELYTKANWDGLMQRMLTDYFPNRTDALVEEYQARGLYPDIVAPRLSRQGGQVNEGAALEIAAPVGTVYFTTDGTDPRQSVANLSLLTNSAPKQTFFTSNASVGTELGLDWIHPDFDDSDWSTGSGTVGYENTQNGDYSDFINVDTSEMSERNTSLYIRSSFEFDATQTSGIEQLSLKMRADDGFVAYLNGVEVARKNAPQELAWNSEATAITADNDALNFEDFDITAFVDGLRNGTNVLAVHGLNAGVSSSDFLISSEIVASSSTGEVAASAQQYVAAIPLDATSTIKARVFDGTGWSALTEARYVLDSPIRVSELNYNPVGPTESPEFIELVNTGETAIDLAGYHFTDGIEYEFPQETPVLVEPGNYIVVAADPDVLRALHPELDAAAIAPGNFTGSLSNGGERIAFSDANGGLVQDFAYSDDWYPVTDGDGRTLTIVDAKAAKASWNDAEAWLPSSVSGGTPGIADPDIVADIVAPRLHGKALVPISVVEFRAMERGGARELGGLSDPLMFWVPAPLRIDDAELEDVARGQPAHDEIKEGVSRPQERRVEVTEFEPVQRLDKWQSLIDSFFAELKDTSPQKGLYGSGVR